MRAATWNWCDQSRGLAKNEHDAEGDAAQDKPREHHIHATSAHWSNAAIRYVSCFFGVAIGTHGARADTTHDEVMASDAVTEEQLSIEPERQRNATHTLPTVVTHTL